MTSQFISDRLQAIADGGRESQRAALAQFIDESIQIRIQNPDFNRGFIGGVVSGALAMGVITPEERDAIVSTKGKNVFKILKAS